MNCCYIAAKQARRHLLLSGPVGQTVKRAACANRNITADWIIYSCSFVAWDS